MNKLAIILCCLSLSFAPIEEDKKMVQNEFLKCVFGDEFNKVKRKLTFRGFTCFKENGNINIGHLVFGGYDWEHGYFHFDKQKKLCMVVFSHHFVNANEALDVYNDIKYKLMSRYEKDYVIKDDAEPFLFLYTDGERDVSLSCEQAQARNGERYFYVTLTYRDIALCEAEVENTKNEL